MIAILDFGSQYTKLIARRIRELGVFSEILPWDITLPDLLNKKPEGIIFSGGPASVLSPDAPAPEREILETGIPILGICYGMQIIAKMLGGAVSSGKEREYGKTEIKVLSESPLFKEIPERSFVWMSHGDSVTLPPPGFTITAEGEKTKIAAMENSQKRIYGLQFHPEVAHTDYGMKILDNFLTEICKARKNWNMENFLKKAIIEIKEKVGNERVLCALSGGVDSTVAATLVKEIIGDNLIAVFVNNGLLRKGEPEEVRSFFEERNFNLVYIDASENFLEKLKGVTDPEEKRRIIGHEFIKVFEEVASKQGKIKFLLQGTLYPDVIESGSGGKGAAKIKSHHNVGGLPEKLDFELLEPLKDLFKDEVRKLGKLLDIPEKILKRHPFPGPGLAVRVLGEVTKEKLNILRKADKIVQEEFRENGWYDKVWQAFAVLLPIKSVGVMGDERSYGYTIALRVVSSEDGMTADWVKLPYEILEKISNRITREVEGVNRVVYDITSKPPATIEWE
ncbi:MAG: glutamine-hydrolyzing GMP synthase [Synergistetes bacterium]|nr:glutamine-hydrolyzing GMP synthase [Synergistota bacterium]MCX8127394.1 glutamine-hydrolyzing GMP synthase [Synergistota bacterium]MDW8192258.1 glutamine-hydrolyzing GMP synthase [Synergistota bacterium]